MHLLANRADAEDAAQEVFLRLHRFLGRMDPARDPTAWIYRITVNVCRDLARARPPAGYGAEPAAPGNTDDAICRDERRLLVRRALAALSPKQRAARLRLKELVERLSRRRA